MLAQIDPADSRPIYVQIMDEVRRAMVVGTLETDDPLPSVRQLATELRVNPNTVQQAYRELEREGVVYVRRGQGTFVRNGRDADRGRSELAAAVAERAVRDAYRHGIGLDELIERIRETGKNMNDQPTQDHDQS